MITCIILSYKRPENINKWMAGIKNQTIKSEVWVWDSLGDYIKGSGEDVLFTVNRNFSVQPKFLMPGLVKTKYIYNQDDDLAIKDKFLFEKFISMAEKYPDSFIGWNGRMAEYILNWEKAYSFPGGGFCDYMDKEATFNLDMVNTGVAFYRTALINQIPMNPFRNDIDTVTEKEYKYGDDMWISKHLKSKRVMDFNLKDYYEWLPEYPERGCCVSKQSDHMGVRDELMRRYFKK